LSTLGDATSTRFDQPFGEKAIWTPLKTHDFDGRAVILTAQVTDKRWKYLRNAKKDMPVGAQKKGFSGYPSA
jgi:hypothetical protein